MQESIKFNYIPRGETQPQEIELPIINPDFYMDGFKIVEMYSDIQDIRQKYKNMYDRKYIDELETIGITAEMLANSTYTKEQRSKAELLALKIPTNEGRMVLEIYKYLVSNIFVKDFEYIKVEWDNPRIPFKDIAIAYINAWEDYFTPASQSIPKENEKEKESENKSELKKTSKKSKKS